MGGATAPLLLYVPHQMLEDIEKKLLLNGKIVKNNNLDVKSDIPML